MSAADPRRLHRPRGGEIRRPEAHSMHARRGRGDRGDIVDALRRLQDRMDEDRLLEAMSRLEQGEILVDEMDVPVALDLGDHDDVELVADLADKPRHVVEKPGRVQRIDAHPQARRAEIGRLRHGDQPIARGDLGFNGDRVLEIAEHDIDLARELARFRPHLLVVRRHEMDHALEPRRQLEKRTRRADRERLEIFARGFHERRPWMWGFESHRAISQAPQLDARRGRSRQLLRPLVGVDDESIGT